MAGLRGIATLAFLAAFAIIATLSLTLDENLTDDFEEVLHDDEFAIVVTHIRPKKTMTAEAILATEFTKSKTKFVVMLDRHRKRIMMETVERDKQSMEHLMVDSMNVSVPIKNIIFYVRQQQPSAHIEVYVDCIHEGTLPLQETFRDIAELDGAGSTAEVVSPNNQPIDSIEGIMNKSKYLEPLQKQQRK